MQYRLIIGHKHNERGNIVDTKAKTLTGAYRALRRRIDNYLYPQDMWGRIEQYTDGGWMRICDDCTSMHKIRVAGYNI